jgi:hypothetical protein
VFLGGVPGQVSQHHGGGLKKKSIMIPRRQNLGDDIFKVLVGEMVTIFFASPNCSICFSFSYFGLRQFLK